MLQKSVKGIIGHENRHPYATSYVQSLLEIPMGNTFPLEALKPEQAPRSYRTTVEISEDRSDNLIVAEARVSPGLLIRRTSDNTSKSVNRPQKVYNTNSERELVSPKEGSVILTPGDCKIVLESQVEHAANPKDLKTWSVFTKYGLSVTQPGAMLVRQDGQYDMVTQFYQINYADNAEWGCLVLRCMSQNLFYGKEIYCQNEYLTLFFHRSHQDYMATAYPPMLTLNKPADQNYIPLTPGQILQVVLPADTPVQDIQDKGDCCVIPKGCEQLGKAGKMVCERFECLRSPQKHQLLFVEGPNSASMILPPIEKDGKDVFAAVTQPYKTVKVLCDNINCLRVRFVRNIPRIEFPTKMMEVINVNTENHEINFRFLRPLGTVMIASDKDVCSLSCTLPGFGTCYPPKK